MKCFPSSSSGRTAHPPGGPGCRAGLRTARRRGPPEGGTGCSRNESGSGPGKRPDKARRGRRGRQASIRPYSVSIGRVHFKNCFYGNLFTESITRKAARINKDLTSETFRMHVRMNVCRLVYAACRCSFSSGMIYLEKRRFRLWGMEPGKISGRPPSPAGPLREGRKEIG